MKLILSTIVFFFYYCAAIGQDSPDEREQKRHAKIEIIQRIQDRRTVHDGKLIEFLSDPDTTVRARAVFAYGSIQDTTVLSLLVNHLSDSDPVVQYYAAFAIGQTAQMLSNVSRKSLEHDLIWTRFDNMSSQSLFTDIAPTPKDRLIEELGKFGTEQALHDILLRFGTDGLQVRAQTLMLSIARFAIRNITTSDGISYLMKFIKPAERISWEGMYALQRIGDRRGVRDDLAYIIPLYRHSDPLVRMNYATLLGKLKDKTTSIEPLLKLAEFDSDWRVRVNAIKALGNFNLQMEDQVLSAFKRFLVNENLYLGTTALAALSNSGIKQENASPALQELFERMKAIAQNSHNEYVWQLQTEAALTLAKLLGPNAVPYINPSAFSERHLQSQLLTALGTTGSPSVAPLLASFLAKDNNLLVRGALEGLQSLSEKVPGDSVIVTLTYQSCISLLQKRDVAVLTTAASILGDSLFRRPASLPPLLETLSKLRVPDEIEAIQEIAGTLGKLKDRRAIDGLTELLRQTDRSVVQAAAAALQAITGDNYSSSIPQSSDPLYTDFDFTYLRSLPDTIHIKIETLRGDIYADLYKDIAPFTIMSFLKLASQKGFYRGTTFHRVVPNFVIQGGDPRGDGWGGPGYALRSEFSHLTYAEGTLGIASAGKDTEGSQFFITQSAQPHLDGRYTIFGRVTKGMEVVNSIQLDDHIYDVKFVQ